jgi:hypothetical protein
LFGHAAVRRERRLPGYHFDAINNGTNREAQRAARAILVDFGQMGARVEFDRLVPAVVTRQVALATIDAHFLIKKKFVKKIKFSSIFYKAKL